MITTFTAIFPRYFTTEKLLSDHWAKKPEHRIDAEALFREAGQAREADGERERTWNICSDHS